MNATSNPILVQFAKEGTIASINLFDVKWVETVYYKKEKYTVGSNVVYRVTMNDDRMVIIPREAIGQAYYQQKLNESVAVTYYDEATKTIAEVGEICRSFQKHGYLQGAGSWRYARWIKEKLGVSIEVPWHSQDEIL